MQSQTQSINPAQMATVERVCGWGAVHVIASRHVTELMLSATMPTMLIGCKSIQADLNRLERAVCIDTLGTDTVHTRDEFLASLPSTGELWILE